MAIDFHHLHAIITGGSSGIGKALASLLARQGARLTLIARDPARLEAARAEVEALRASDAQNVMAISADVGVREQVERAVSEAIRALGPPGLLVTCAGVVRPGQFMDLPISAFERTMQVDYFGTLYAVRAVVPAMQAQGRGHIVMLASGAGLVGVYGYSSYSPAKFAVYGLAEALRAELKPDGIGLSIVFPPDTDTPQYAEEMKVRSAEMKAIGEMGGLWSADAVAQVIVDGVRRGEFRITPGLEMTLLTRLKSLFSPLLEWQIDQLVARAREQNEDER